MSTEGLEKGFQKEKVESSNVLVNRVCFGRASKGCSSGQHCTASVREVADAVAVKRYVVGFNVLGSITVRTTGAAFQRSSRLVSAVGSGPRRHGPPRPHLVTTSKALVTTSVALVTRSDALVTSSFLLLLGLHEEIKTMSMAEAQRGWA